jgi:hypothetical protein
MAKPRTAAAATRASPGRPIIAELTRGIELPLDALKPAHLSVISEVLSMAWDQLLQTSRASLLSGSEPVVNQLMEVRLNALLETHHMWRQLVRSVSLGTERTSFDGAHLEKAPDLSIHLTCRNPSFPLSVECKVINSSTGQGCDRYCEQGVARFVRGEYGWAVRECFMLGYVRDGSTISSSLTPWLTESESRNPRPYSVQQLPIRIDLLSLDLAHSVHGRSFKYPNRQHAAPGPIAIWHLWMLALVSGASCCGAEPSGAAQAS